jgi:hypothetical protein
MASPLELTRQPHSPWPGRTPTRQHEAPAVGNVLDARRHVMPSMGKQVAQAIEDALGEGR